MEKNTIPTRKNTWGMIFVRSFFRLFVSFLSRSGNLSLSRPSMLCSYCLNSLMNFAFCMIICISLLWIYDLNMESVNCLIFHHSRLLWLYYFIGSLNLEGNQLLLSDEKKYNSHPKQYMKNDFCSFILSFVRQFFSLARAISLLAAQACCVHNVRVFVRNDKAGGREEI